MLLARDYYEEASKMASKCLCPECWRDSRKEVEMVYASDDDNVLVCKSCDFSADDTDMYETWIEAFLNEFGVEYLDDEESF